MNAEYMKAIDSARTEAKDFGEPAIVYSYKFRRIGFTHFGYCMEANFEAIQEVLGFPLLRQLKIMPNGKIMQ